MRKPTCKSSSSAPLNMRQSRRIAALQEPVGAQATPHRSPHRHGMLGHVGLDGGEQALRGGKISPSAARSGRSCARAALQSASGVLRARASSQLALAPSRPPCRGCPAARGHWRAFPAPPTAGRAGSAQCPSGRPGERSGRSSVRGDAALGRVRPGSAGAFPPACRHCCGRRGRAMRSPSVLILSASRQGAARWSPVQVSVVAEAPEAGSSALSTSPSALGAAEAPSSRPP